MVLDENIKAVAFDIDGTLYPEWKLTVRILPIIFSHLKFFWHYGKVRHVMHKTGPLPDFYEYQARLLGEKLKCPSEKSKALIQNIIYEGFKDHFTKIPCFNGVEELFKSLKEKGYKIALLSDFNPEQKGEMWGLKKYCDAIMGTESIGALKPSKYPFGVMAKTLGVELNQILYVGNSEKYDVKGAKNCGMKSAYIHSWFACKSKIADINFTSYRNLKKILLGE